MYHLINQSIGLACHSVSNKIKALSGAQAPTKCLICLINQRVISTFVSLALSLLLLGVITTL